MVFLILGSVIFEPCLTLRGEVCQTFDAIGPLQFPVCTGSKSQDPSIIFLPCGDKTLRTLQRPTDAFGRCVKAFSELRRLRGPCYVGLRMCEKAFATCSIWTMRRPQQTLQDERIPASILGTRWTGDAMEVRSSRSVQENLRFATETM